MRPGHLARIYGIEVEKLFRRLTSHLGLTLAVAAGLLGVGTLALYAWFTADTHRVAEINQQIIAPPDWHLGHTINLAFLFRSLVVFPMTLFVLAALTFASELRSQTIREDLLRPVPRWSVLAAKLGALVTWIAASVVATWAISAVVGFLIFGFKPDFWYVWDSRGPGAFYLAVDTLVLLEETCVLPLNALLSEAMFAGIALLLAILTRSVAATVGGMVLVFLAQLVVWGSMAFVLNQLADPMDLTIFAELTGTPQWLLWAVRDTTIALYPWQPPYLMLPSLPTWHSLTTVALVLVSCAAVGTLRFWRMDVP